MIYAISFTDNGKSAAQELADIKDMDITSFAFDELETPLKSWCEDAFKKCEAIVFVGAAGIATRLIAPNIKDKATDPAVIVIDEKKQFVIPILSGHIGGGNELAEKIARHIGAVPVITTATDINSLFAVDVFCKKNNLHISDMKIAKEISARLLKKQEVCIFPNEYTFSEIPKELTKKTTGEVGIYIGNDGFEPFGKTLVATVKDVFVGVGMKKGTSFCDFEKAFLTFLEENKISLYSVKGICSIDLKKDEQAIIMLSEKYKIQTIFFSSKQLCEIEGSFTSSDFVKSVTGTENVCEKSAFLGSGKYKIIKRKTIINHITFALAKEKTDIVF